MKSFTVNVGLFASAYAYAYPVAATLSELSGRYGTLNITLYIEINIKI